MKKDIVATAYLTPEINEEAFQVFKSSLGSDLPISLAQQLWSVAVAVYELVDTKLMPQSHLSLMDFALEIVHTCTRISIKNTSGDLDYDDKYDEGWPSPAVVLGAVILQYLAARPKNMMSEMQLLREEERMYEGEEWRRAGIDERTHPMQKAHIQKLQIYLPNFVDEKFYIDQEMNISVSSAVSEPRTLLFSPSKHPELRDRLFSALGSSANKHLLGTAKKKSK